MDRSDKTENESIRTIAVFFGGVVVGLLGYVQATLASCATCHVSHTTSKGIYTLLLLSLLCTLLVAALRQPPNAKVSNFILNFAFLSLLVGILTFTWEVFGNVVGAVLTTAAAILICTYAIGNASEQRPVWENLQGLWKKHQELAVMRREDQEGTAPSREL